MMSYRAEPETVLLVYFDNKKLRPNFCWLCLLYSAHPHFLWHSAWAVEK